MTNILFAQDSLPNAQPGGMLQTVLMILIAGVFFYFILYRPNAKKQKQEADMRAALKKGDRVTAMAIVGTVEKINEHTIVIKTEGSKIEMLKAAITDVQPATSVLPEA